MRRTRRRLLAAVPGVPAAVAACVPGGPRRGGGGEPGSVALRSGAVVSLAHFYPASQQDNVKRRIALFQQETPGVQVSETALPNGAAYRSDQPAPRPAAGVDLVEGGGCGVGARSMRAGAAHLRPRRPAGRIGRT